MKITEEKGRSPYARYHKRPHRYSDEYRAWDRAVTVHGADSIEAIEADAAFRRRFGIAGAVNARH